MNRQLLVDYAELKLQEKDIAEKVKILKDPVLAELLSIIGDEKRPVKLEDYGTMIIVRKPMWVYSDRIKILEKELKQMKAEEEATGAATCEYSEFPMFKPFIEE